MSAKTGFKIGSEFYPMVTALRMADPVLIEQITGVPFSVFVTREDVMVKRMTADPDDMTAFDPVVALGRTAVAIWQRHEDWEPSEVVSYCRRLDMSRLISVGGGADPPVRPARSRKRSRVSSVASISTPEDSPGEDPS